MIALSIVAIGVSLYSVARGRQLANNLSLRGSYEERFPYIADDVILSPEQIRVVEVLRAEFATRPAGTKYSEGVAEPWCADFVSWVMKEAGMPFVNPNSGGWRIPGTMTLRDYFQQNGNWHPYGDGYVPKTGDVAIYDGNGPHGQHANFVVLYSDGTLSTVGGNEAGTIHAQQHSLNDELKVIGFGELKNG